MWQRVSSCTATANKSVNSGMWIVCNSPPTVGVESSFKTLLNDSKWPDGLVDNSSVRSASLRNVVSKVQILSGFTRVHSQQLYRATKDGRETVDVTR